MSCQYKVQKKLLLYDLLCHSAAASYMCIGDGLKSTKKVFDPDHNVEAHDHFFGTFNPRRGRSFDAYSDMSDAKRTVPCALQKIKGACDLDY